ncbi:MULTISPECIES: LacI family DNA-binding transcriptional regulator [unclassified Actinopolyspora]|uniref:LacI family DNA-binding transcriptional regulator n=1 Tax=unclassified Actinopolyspora TaxID=2639451 RepID=UPI0013F5A3E3|nr:MULTISPECIES: LacI family DNA-binding transcriptional regulator [unclassified Actinopolyspora]NHD15922.1 LacI family transcriptional regulator [Actinopolyspora sp. BKK2]NHE74864.1 LacI family transcriptional regulator [Actinopolyspora sp. BKK1]
MGSGDRPDTVTIHQVAKAARVSPATVSRVMNRRQSVDPELARRVQQVAASLGYQPNAVARGLARGRTGVIAVIVPDLGNPMFQSVLRGVSRAAGNEDYRVLVTDSHEFPLEETLLSWETRLRADGLVLCAPRTHDQELLGIAGKLEPFVLVNRHVDGMNVPTVSVDYASGVRAVVAHLAWLGHTRVAYLSGPVASTSNQERLESLHEATHERMTLDVIECGSMHEDGYEAADRALATGATAVIGYNDVVALGALGKLHEIGVAVPNDISVVGFDDIPFARYCAPRLTTVSVPQEELGLQAWNRLSALLHDHALPADVCFTPRLEVRGSTGPVAR